MKGTKMKTIIFLLIAIFAVSCNKSRLEEQQPFDSGFIHLKPMDSIIQVQAPRAYDSIRVLLVFYPCIDWDSIQIVGMWDPGSLKRETIYGRYSQFLFYIYPWGLRGFANIQFNQKNHYDHYLLKTTPYK